MKVTTEFKSNTTHFLKRTARRLVCELSLLAVITAVVALDLMTAIPMWFQLVIVAAVSIYIAIELALYPRAKAVADSLSIKLHDQGLTFVRSGGGGELRYSDLRIAGVRKREDKVTEIVLAARSGQTIKLQGFENMDELYRLLSERIAS
jgi:hypothetical protein